ncbi:acyl-CoA dehydrogenase [Kineococcus sp. SYSU DK002]|uniref:acyl-CoA dehydrogenase n=1 Tax=Kineococcus sp. SYSU DK002 TaxID=3383123 RepID=UPI003D7EF05D
MLVTAALDAARRVTTEVPLPAGGRTRRRWQVLAVLAAQDLTTARVVEAHLDAVAIRAEAGLATPDGTTWGVFAAEAPDVRLDATPGDGDGWRLTGTKPWCSLAGDLTHALVTAHTAAGRRLFAVDLAAARADGTAEVLPDRWHSRGLVDVPSGPVAFRAVPADPVGEAGWYLRRPGFAHGGIGVAACWFGGAVGVARPLRRSERHDPLTRRSRGTVEHHLWTARLALDHAAAAVDAGAAGGPAGELLALRTRTVVATAAEAVLTEVGHALGPAPLTLDRDHAARVADLTVYLRQHHADHDLAALGERAGQTGPEDEQWPW